MKKYKLVTFLMFSAFLFSCSSLEDVAKKNTVFNNSIIQRANKESVLNNYNPELEVDRNSEVVQYLIQKGDCSKVEILLMSKVEKEVYPNQIKSIIFTGNHYYYDGFDNGQTEQNCGLYAAKRLLRHLGQNGIVDKDLWYRYSDVELREMVVSIAGNEYRSQAKPLYELTVRQLLIQLGCPNEYIKIQRSGCFWQDMAKERIRNGRNSLQFLRDILEFHQDMIPRIDSGYYDEIANREGVKEQYLLLKDDDDAVNRMIRESEEGIAKDQDSLTTQDYSHQ
jgi:hypothetical protein